MRLVTSLVALAAAGVAAASPLSSQQKDSARVWFSSLPSNITFDCHGRIPGYYADVDSGCQMYHMCDPQSRLYSYVCPAYTEFSQFYMTCVQHDRVNCAISEKFFHMNEMIGKPSTRFHDHRQHDHSKKKDTEGSKATNRVDTSEPAGHVIFEFETKMDMPLKRSRRPPSRSRAFSATPTAGSGSSRAGAAPSARRPANKWQYRSTAAPSPSPRRLYKTLSPPQATSVVAAPTRAPTTAPPLKRSRVTTSAKPSSPTDHGDTTARTAYKARPRVRFSDLTGSASTTAAPVKTRTTPKPAPASAPNSPALPQNTYRTFGRPGSFSFGTLMSRNNKPVTPLPLTPVTAARRTTARSTVAPPTRASPTKAPPTEARSTAAPTSRARPTKATTRAIPTTAPPTAVTSRATAEAAQTLKDVTTTAKPLHLKPRVRLTSTTTKAPKRSSTLRTNARSSAKSTTARSPATQIATPRSTTAPSTTRRPTSRRATTPWSTTKTTSAKPATTKRKTTRLATTKSTTTTTKSTTTTTKSTTTTTKSTTSTTESTTSRPRSTTKPATRRPSTSRTTKAKPTTPKRTTARPTTTTSTTTKPTTTRRTTPQSTTHPRRRVTQSVNKTKPSASPSTEKSPVAPTTGTPKRAPAATSIPSLLGKQLPPVEELEALRLSFTLDPPRLAMKLDGPHEQRNMKVRGELITGEMALRQLRVDQLKPVYFPNPSIPLNLLPPLLSEQEAPDGKQTTTLTLPVNRQNPGALLQAAAVAFNLLPPELASLVPPMLTAPPPPLPSAGATPATSAAKTPARSNPPTPSRPTAKPRKHRPGLTMKFGKKKTRFRVEDSHGSPADACYPCMKSFVKDLERCHPCVIIR